MKKDRPTFPLTLETLGTKKSVSKSTQGFSGRGANYESPAVAGQGVSKVETKKKVSELNVPSGVGLDSSAVRENMVKKLAQQGIQDTAVLSAMLRVERHRFVDSALVNQAYEDTSLPIGLGQTISKPNVVARMIALLRQGKCVPADGKLGRVLEIGTGCGYQAAVLSLVCKEVYSIERLKGLFERAKNHLRPMRVPNLHLIFGDGMAGYAPGAPYAGIIAAAGGENVPQAWLDQLAVGGRVVAPVMTGAQTQSLLVVDRTESGFQHAYLEAVQFVPLKSGID